MLDFITEIMATHDDDDAKLIHQQKATASKSNSLICLNLTNPREFIEGMIEKHKFVLQALNKVYILKNDRIIISKENDDVVDSISHHVLQIMKQLRVCNNHNQVRVKLEVFPSRQQRNYVTKVCSLLNMNSIPESELDISPSGVTHTISIILLNERKCDQNIQQPFYFIGSSTCMDTTSPIYPSEANDICRAFNKLKEAFDRYGNAGSLQSLNEIIQLANRENSGPCIGIDCGSAPGGWTKYLIEETHCEKVYAIDPGEMILSESLSVHVDHLKMTAQKAIPHLRDTLKHKVCIWVSDMCVQDVGKQVDIFLLAIKEKIIQSGAAFVLTIKCYVGHAKETFDEITNAEANRLKEHVDVEGLEILHLFSNRIGERTIIGYVK